MSNCIVKSFLETGRIVSLMILNCGNTSYLYSGEVIANGIYIITGSWATIGAINVTVLSLRTEPNTMAGLYKSDKPVSHCSEFYLLESIWALDKQVFYQWIANYWKMLYNTRQFWIVQRCRQSVGMHFFLEIVSQNQSYLQHLIVSG